MFLHPKSPFKTFICSLIFTLQMPAEHTYFSKFILFKSKKVASMLKPSFASNLAVC